MLRQRARAESFRRRPRYARLLDGWRVRRPRSSLWVNWRLGRLEGTPDDPKAVRAVGLPPWSRDALETTGFALDQFKARADRDGATVVVLAPSDLGSPLGTDEPAGRGFDGLNAMAAARGFPVVSQHDYVIRQGGRHVEGWYNTRRRHSALGYLSPLDFERLRETAPADGDRPGEALEPAVRVAPDALAPAGVVTGVAAGNTGRA